MGCSICSPTQVNLIEIIQGYYKTYQLDLLLATTNEPYDLTGNTQIKAIHPGMIGVNQTGPVVEYSNNSVFSTTGTTLSGSATVTGLTSVVGLTPGLNVSGTGIPASTQIASVGPGNQITLTNNATASGSPTLTFTGSGTNVTVVGAPGAGKIQVTIPQADSANLLVNPSPQQAQDLQISVTNSAGTIDSFLIPAVLNIVAPTYGVL